MAGFPRLFAERLRKELATGAQLRTFFNLWSSFREMVLRLESYSATASAGVVHPTIPVKVLGLERDLNKRDREYYR